MIRRHEIHASDLYILKKSIGGAVYEIVSLAYFNDAIDWLVVRNTETLKELRLNGDEFAEFMERTERFSPQNREVTGS